MKKILSLLLSLLSFALVLSSCAFTSPENEFPLPEDTSPVLKVPYDQLQVDWDKAIEDAITAFHAINEMAYVEIQKTDDSFDFYAPFWSMEGYGISYTALYEANILLRALNDAAAQQDNRISKADVFSYGSIYDVFTVHFQSGKDKIVYINDTLFPGEHRTRGLKLLTAPVSADLHYKSLEPVVYATLQSNTDSILSSVHFFSLCDGLKVWDSDLDKEIWTPENKIFWELSLTFKKGTAREAMRAYSEKVLRTLNAICKRQDPSIPEPDESSYGGIFEHIELQFSVSTLEDPETDPPIRRYYYKGLHTPDDPPFQLSDYEVDDTEGPI